MSESGVRVGDIVRIMTGLYKGITGVVIALEEGGGEALIRFTSDMHTWELWYEAPEIELT